MRQRFEKLRKGALAFVDERERSNGLVTTVIVFPGVCMRGGIKYIVDVLSSAFEIKGQLRVLGILLVPTLLLFSGFILVLPWLFDFFVFATSFKSVDLTATGFATDLFIRSESEGPLYAASAWIGVCCWYMAPLESSEYKEILEQRLNESGPAWSAKMFRAVLRPANLVSNQALRFERFGGAALGFVSVITCLMITALVFRVFT